MKYNLLKNILCSALVLSLVFSLLFSLPAYAAEATEGECGWNAYWDYDADSKTLTITGDGYVEFQEAPWIYFVNEIETVIVSNDIKSLCEDFMCGAERLSSVTLGTGLTYVDECAFENCDSLKSITIPDNIEKIGANAFYGCDNLENIAFSNNISYIGFFALQDTKWLSDRENGTVYAGNVLYTYKSGTASAVTIKDGTLGISDFAFENAKQLQTVVLPDSLKNIGNGAFENCSSLKNAQICDTLEYCGGKAFENTAWLSNMPNGPVYIGTCFYTYHGKCESNSISVKAGTTCVSGFAFYKQTSLKKIVLPNSVMYIGDFAYSYIPSLETNIPSNLQTINAAFFACDKAVINFTNEYSAGYNYATKNKMNMRSKTYITGDVSFNGRVNNVDVLFLRKYLSGIKQPIELNAADTNKDGVVNSKDLLLLRKAVAGITKL